MKARTQTVIKRAEKAVMPRKRARKAKLPVDKKSGDEESADEDKKKTLMQDLDNIEWSDPKMAALDLQYHDLRPSKGLARRIGLSRITNDAQVEAAITQPPPTTRAFFRGRCLEKFPDQIVAANWDSMVFDVGSDPLRRVPMLEPLRGTAAHVASLLDECDDAGELLRRLGT